MPLHTKMRSVSFVVFIAAASLLACGAAFAQSGGKAPEPQKPTAADTAAKEGQKKIDEIAEA